LPSDFTTWKTLDLRDDSGCLIDEEHQKTILEVANKALETGQRDPRRILQAAKRIGRRAHLVENLRAYAVRAIFRVKNTVGSANVKEEQLTDVEYAPQLTDNSQVEQIENHILVRELLDTLSPLDREIFVRRMDGMTCVEIDLAMDLKPRTAEIRFDACKNALRKAFQEKANRRLGASGC
jgi:DNA-directed RNA polymerase specialized sigma24 family protein